MKYEFHFITRQRRSETQRCGLDCAAKWRRKDNIYIVVRKGFTEDATLFLALGGQHCVANAVVVLRASQLQSKV